MDQFPFDLAREPDGNSRIPSYEDNRDAAKWRIRLLRGVANLGPALYSSVALSGVRLTSTGGIVWLHVYLTCLTWEGFFNHSCYVKSLLVVAGSWHPALKTIGAGPSDKDHLVSFPSDAFKPCTVK
jgi:hypothetical protein